MYKSLINMNHAYENFFDSLNLEMLLLKKVPMLYEEETMNNIFLRNSKICVWTKLQMMMNLHLKS